MSRYSGNDRTCPVCGVRYAEFRTGLTYQEVFDRLKDFDEVTSKWSYKRRGTVLGKWHQYKKEAWSQHINECIGGAEFERGDAYEPPLPVHVEVEGVPF